MLLATLALVFALGAPGSSPAPALSATPSSQLPATQPGLTDDEGVFLVTTADNGSQVMYFVAQNTRHSILASDLRLEQQLNPLWPVHTVSQDEALRFAEGAPIAAARTGLLTTPVVEDASASLQSPADPPPPVADVGVATDSPSDGEAPATYVVKRGDSAITIARQFNVDVAALLAANDVQNANRVFIGQILTIPAA